LELTAVAFPAAKAVALPPRREKSTTKPFPGIFRFIRPVPKSYWDTFKQLVPAVAEHHIKLANRPFRDTTSRPVKYRNLARGPQPELAIVRSAPILAMPDDDRMRERRELRREYGYMGLAAPSAATRSKWLDGYADRLASVVHSLEAPGVWIRTHR
jgi:hypothetical protein